MKIPWFRLIGLKLHTYKPFPEPEILKLIVLKIAKITEQEIIMFLDAQEEFAAPLFFVNIGLAPIFLKTNP
jgi:hypothetical protein